MINVAHLRAFVAASPGDRIDVSKAQMAELLADIEIGQTARRSLSHLRTETAIAASAAGAPR